MKKLFYFAAAAAALAACAKNEVIPVNSGENQEITFNVAPKTKADLQTFDTRNVFASWAYYLPKGSTWDANSGNAVEYISGAEIAYREKTTGRAEKVWKAGQSYYWPKDGGRLTFFAYSLNKDDLNLAGGDSGFSCGASQGIHGGIHGAIDLQANPNTDFLVADIAKDKESNENVHFTNGVPTLFRHRLSSVAFAIKTGAAYANKAFSLTGITIHNISHYGSYGQLPEELFAASGTDYDPIFFSATQGITTDFANVESVDKYIFIPQIFEDKSYVEVNYTITTTVGSSPVTENVTKTIQLNTLFPTKYDTSDPTKVIGGGWEMGKKYTINLTFTLDEILWNPAVQKWEDVNIGTDTAPIIVG